MARMLQAILMGFGPFYFYPWKAPINMVAGDDYATAFKHFYSGHRHATNLALHAVCLVLQLLGNFALLGAVDRRLGALPQVLPMGVSTLAAVSAGMWAAYSYFAAPTCPELARLGSVLAITGALVASPLVTPAGLDQGIPAAMVALLWASNYAMAKTRVPLIRVLKLTVVMGLWATAWPAVEGFVVGGLLGGPVAADKVALVQGACAAYVFGVALLRNPLKPLVLSSVPLLRLAAAAAGGDPILFYWSYAFAASLFQGLTHNTVQEEATLLALERESEARKLKFEWAHVTHFPNLAMHAVTRALGIVAKF